MTCTLGTWPKCWETIRIFPDVSNTHYSLHGDAATKLIGKLQIYWEFLEHVRDAKDKSEFMNIELNLYNALSDIPTVTELAVMSLYLMCISHPFMEHARCQREDSRNRIR